MLIETMRIHTRRAEPTDTEFVARVLTNEDVQRHIGGVKASYNQTIDHIQRKPETLSSFYIVETIRGDRIGYLAMVPNYELGVEEPLISLLPEYWRRGYGREILENLKEHWLAKNDEMLVTANPKNTASLGLLKQLGFSFQSTVRNKFSQEQYVYRATK